VQHFLPLRTGVLAVLTAILCQAALAQDAPNKEAQIRDAKGLPPRASPADYQAKAQAGAYTIAAEFTGHSVAMPESVLSTDDFVVVEVGLFGPPEARIKLSFEDFSLRINGKKTPVPAQPYGLVFKSLKDPELEPSAEAKSKTSLDTGAGGKGQGGANAPPEPVHIPIEVKRAMEQHVQKAALPEGERTLPQAGLIFFGYTGKSAGIHSVELIYSGAAGKAVLALNP
jgi:hypothetical protein